MSRQEIPPAEFELPVLPTIVHATARSAAAPATPASGAVLKATTEFTSSSQSTAPPKKERLFVMRQSATRPPAKTPPPLSAVFPEILLPTITSPP